MARFGTVFRRLFLVFLIPRIQASCSEGMFGESCRYSCNCQMCRQVTGSCPGSCNAGWVKGGQLCQKQNIAYKKKAWTGNATLYPHWPPSNAVDGDTNITGWNRTCFHGEPGKNRLAIDLGEKRKLSHIRLYLRDGYNHRIANSYIFLDGVRSRVCYTFPPSVSNNPTDVVCNAEARRLIIENPGNDSNKQNTPLNICEVEIYQCSNGTYGVNCTNFCHCNSHDSCDGTTGVCTGDCYAGWKGNRCDTECESTRYGINCVQDCESRHCARESSSCDRYTGRCDTGCLPGWWGKNCTIRCNQNYYGQKCSKACDDRHCYGQSYCNHVNGLCDHGCQKGWKGTDCREECVNSYGFNCNMACGNRKCAGDMESCDRFNGSCDRCLSGWEGVDCTKKCDSLHFGLRCALQCRDRHCTGIDSSCNHVTGRCDQGCLPGWQGDDCLQVCTNTRYGPGCLKECGSRQCNGARDCNRTNGECLEGCQSGWTGIDCAKRIEELTVGGNVAVTAGVVAGCLVAVIVLIIVVIVVWRRRSHEGNNNRNPEEAGNEYANIGLEDRRINLPNVETKLVVNQAASLPEQGRSVDKQEEIDTDSLCTRDGEEEEGTGNYYNLDDARRDSDRRDNVIPVSQLPDKMAKMRKNKKLIEKEYKKLPDGFMYPFDVSQKAENNTKNRYQGYYPYNYNRVVLHNVRDDSAWDYINASYLDGYQSERKYIAAQGPYKSFLIVDFWRMLWQEGCKVVVMVTGLVETGKMKCLQYWPENGTETYGDVTVSNTSENVLADFTITTLTVQHRVEMKSRQVVHFHFTSWPDHGVPDTSALLSYMSKVKSTSGKQNHPIVVHCSAGIGRTGTYIAVEGLIQQAATEGVVDVVNFVSKMREQRKNMIQTSEQYHFIYRAVASSVLEGDTVLTADDITKIDPRRVGETVMGKRNVQGHLETLQKGHKDSKGRNTILAVPSYRSRSGYLVMTSSLDKEELWEQIYNSGSRSLITWSGTDKKVVPVDISSLSTSRLTVWKRQSTEISSNVLFQKLELKRDGESEGTVLYHYQLSGSVGELNVSALAESFIPWTDQPECRTSIIVSSSPSETRLLVLLLNLFTRLQDDGNMDIISDMRRLQSSLPAPRFTLADVRTCIKVVQQQVESLGVYMNM